MSESVEPPAALKLETSEKQEQHEESEKQRSREQDEEKDVSGDSVTLTLTDIVDDREDVRAQTEKTDPDRTLEFDKKEEAEEERMEKEIEKQVQEVVQVEAEKENFKSVEEYQENPSTESMLEHKIEDESMPSLVSSKIDESEIIAKQNESKKITETKEVSPKASPKEEESDDDSVCVIDDDDDDDEDGAQEGIRGESSLEEDSSSYDEDSEEMDEEAYNDRYNKRKKIKRDIELEEDDDEEEEEDDEEEEEEDSENDTEPEDFDRASDDLVLRHSNGLTKHHKERSASLQDLNLIKGESPKKRRNVNPFSSKARYERNQGVDNRNSRKSFPNVESKVKKYIADIGEQRRKSFEQRRQLQDGCSQRKPFKNETETYRTEEIVIDSKNLKSIAEKTFKEMSECEEDEMFISQGIENGEISILPKRSLGNGESEMRQEYMEVDPIQIDTCQMELRIDKVNGAVLDDDQNNYVLEKRGILRCDEYTKPVLNGENQMSSVNDLRTLTYDEYMSGSNKKQANHDNEELIDESEIEEIQQETPPKNNAKKSDASSLRIESVSSNYYHAQTEINYNDPKDQYPMVHQSNEMYYEHSPELYNLRNALDQRNSQFNNLRETYQRTLSENMAMKIELGKLQKIISQYKIQDPTVEKKTVASQTEFFSAPGMPAMQIDSCEQGSLNSALSSKWSDLTGSVINTSEPPHIDTNLLNSDESSVQTKLKQKNPFSRAFLTSTRILQTLSSITHGKSKSKYSKSFVPEAEASSSTQNEDAVQTNSRKRKASDAIFSSSQPSKIPHITSSDTSQNKRKRSSKSPDPQSETIEQESDSKTSEDNANPEKKETEDPEKDRDFEDVKVFEYEDDEDGAKSFLIQANEVSFASKPGVVKECGPYLLGNIEVYMTEKDGTINIWGKELGSSAKNEEKMETSSRSNRSKADFSWQSTPRLADQQASCTTGKKSRVVPRFTHSQRHSCDPISEYDNCGSHNRVPLCSCNHHCHPPHCGYFRGSYKSEPCCNTAAIDPHRCSLPDVHHNNPFCNSSHSNHGKNLVHRHSFTLSDEEGETSEGEENLQNTAHSDLNDTLVPPPSNSSIKKSNSSVGLLSYDSEQDPLIFQRPNSDNQVVQKRRTSGKKVRGLLLNILKGCGDCKAPSDITMVGQQPASEPGTSTQKEDVLSNQPATSNPNERGIGNPNEIAAQLDAFRAEIERLSGQEDALRRLLHGSSTNVAK